MSSQPSPRVALFGTEEKVPPTKVLRAGPLTVELEAGALRHLRYRGVEVLRGIAFLVRDPDWGTYTPTIENPKVGQGPDGFVVSYQATCADATQTFRYRVTITGRADGSLDFAAEGRAETDFATNRAGFVVLHPLEGVVGRPVRVTHTDGRLEEAVFPRLISPAQPLFDIRALAHEVVPGVWATCTMTGDAYEMEDQRNWSDASYKTYVRPLALPKPYTIGAGEGLTQSVSLAFQGTATGATSDGEGPITVAVGGPAGTMPRIGLFVPPEEAEPALEVVGLIRALRPSPLVGQLDLGDPAGAAALVHLKALADAVAAPVVLEIVLPDPQPPAAALAEAARAVRAAGLALEAVVPSPAAYLKSWQPNERWPEVAPLEEIYGAARAAFPGALIGGGMLAYFTELNRQRPPLGPIDFVTHATCPIVHDSDDRAVIETLEALPWIASSVRAFARDRPYRIGPSMLGMRTNPYGTAPAANPDHRRIAMAEEDPRQRGLFAAAWNLGHAARCATAGIDVLTLSAPTGAFGVVHRERGLGAPWFDDHGGVYPVYHVIRGLAGAAGSTRLETTVSDTSVVQAVAHREGGQVIVWLANLTPRRLQVALRGFEGPGRAGRLDVDAFVAAAGDPEHLTRAAPAAPDSIELGPHAVVRFATGA